MSANDTGSGLSPDPSALELEQLKSLGTICELTQALMRVDQSQLAPGTLTIMAEHISSCNACLARAPNDAT